MRVLPLLLLVAIGCRGPAQTAPDYRQMATHTAQAVAALRGVADQGVRRGQISPQAADDAETAAQATLLGLDRAGLAPGLARNAARRALSALIALEALIPAGLIPPPVLIGVAVAEAALDAFVALDAPTAARLRDAASASE